EVVGQAARRGGGAKRNRQISEVMAPANRAIKAHFCDRHHIAIAMAELPSQLSIGAARAVLTFDVPPKHSAPLTRGFFSSEGRTRATLSLRAQDTLEPNLYMIVSLAVLFCLTLC